MFIGIAGPICSGKRTIANFLISNYNFTRLHLRQVEHCSSSNDDFTGVCTPAPLLEDDIHSLTNGFKDVHVSHRDVWFTSMSEMADYVTVRWRENFVTVDIWTEDDLEIIVKRPFFMLISVDAPLTVRWTRFNQRYETTRVGG